MSASNMRLLFITRKYPPSVGGMEKVSYELAKALEKQAPTYVIAWGKSQAYLPFFVLKALIQALWLIPTRQITHIHLGDGVLAPLGVTLSLLTRKPVSVTIHGLDIVYPNPLFRALVPPAVGRLDKVICISYATETECLKRGVPKSKTTVIPWGVNPDEFKIDATRYDLERLVKMDLTNKKILITIGRLVKRKGVAWFINEVMPRLPPNYVYVVAGDGPEHGNIGRAVSSLNLASRIKLLGRVSEQDKKILYNTADLFVMPNIPVADDIEGLGIVALEAASVGLQVLSSSVDGVPKAQPGHVIAKPLDAKDFIESIRRLCTAKPDRIAATQTWEDVGHEYSSRAFA